MKQLKHPFHSAIIISSDIIKQQYNFIWAINNLPLHCSKSETHKEIHPNELQTCKNCLIIFWGSDLTANVWHLSPTHFLISLSQFPTNEVGHTITTFLTADSPLTKPYTHRLIVNNECEWHKIMWQMKNNNINLVYKCPHQCNTHQCLPKSHIIS